MNSAVLLRLLREVRSDLRLMVHHGILREVRSGRRLAMADPLEMESFDRLLVTGGRPVLLLDTSRRRVDPLR